MERLNLILPTAFGLAAVLYLWLSVRVSRESTGASNNSISYFLFLIGIMVAGSAFAYRTSDPNLYGIGRTLTFFATGFLPVALYKIYRELTVGPASWPVLAALSIVPIASTLLAISNPLHNLIWTAVESDGGVRFTDGVDHLWFNRIHAPFDFYKF